MAIYKRHGKWGISYRDPDGVWVRKLLDGATKNEAEAKLGGVKKSILLGSYWDEQKKLEDPPFTIVADEFADWHGKRSRSRDGYTYLIRPLKRHFKSKKLSEITAKMVEGYQESRLGAPARIKGNVVGASTVNRECSLLRRIFNYAIKHGLARTNPAGGFKPLPTPGIRDSFLDTDEKIARLIEAARTSRNQQLEAIIIAALQTGCRKSEILGIRWADVDIRANPGRLVITDTKNSQVHHVILNSVMVALLKKQREMHMRSGTRSEWVFCKPDGTRLQSLKGAWDTACRKAGLADAKGKPLYRFHDLRHTFASQHVMSGTPLYAVSQLLNHKDPTVIRRYAHLSPDFRKQVTEKTAQLSKGWLSLLRYHQDGTSGKHNQ